MYILKPESSSKGIGIEVTTNLNHIVGCMHNNEHKYVIQK